jgi:hypothetical protein
VTFYDLKDRRRSIAKENMMRRLKYSLLAGMLVVAGAYSLAAWAYPNPPDGSYITVKYYTDSTYTTVKGTWTYGSCGRFRSGDTTGSYTQVQSGKCPL